MSTVPYQFIKRGNLFIQPVGPSIAEVPFPTQPYTKPRDYSLWVRGRIEEPSFQLDGVWMPPSLYQEVRNDLRIYSPVEVTRSAFQRSDHAYVGVIDSKGKPYYFALDSRGMSVREVPVDDDRVWKTFDRLADQEREMATKRRRKVADAEMKQVDRELSKPMLVIKSDYFVKADDKLKAWRAKYPQGAVAAQKRTSKKKTEASTAAKPEHVSDEHFARVVQHAVDHAPEDHGFGPHKVFIHHAHEAAKPHLNNMSLDEFKQRLPKHRQDGSLRMARADLVAAMDHKKVSASETSDGPATHHFIERTRKSLTKSKKRSGFMTHKEDGTPIKKPSLYQRLRGMLGKPRTDITEDGDDAPVLPKMKLISKAEKHTGTMVALHIPRDIAEKLVVPGGESAESMHITLAYLGKDLTEEKKAAALCAVRRVAQQHGPVKALLGGVGRFSASHTSEGRDVVYLSVDSPDITRLRPKLIEELAAEGIEPSNAHGFVPHVTLKYIEQSAATPLKRFPPIPVQFECISFTVADNSMKLPFTTPLMHIIKADKPHPHVAWVANELKAGRRVTHHETGTRAYRNESRNERTGKMETTHYTVISPHGVKTFHDTPESAGAKAHEHATNPIHKPSPQTKPAPLPKATARIKKALPKGSKEEKVKKTPTKKASSKKTGKTGKTRYNYPNEKKGGASGAPKAQPLPLVVVQHDDKKNADPSEFANQLGVSVRTLQTCAKKLGREGFAKFMRSHLKRFSAKHRLDPDYWGTLYDKLQPGVG